MLEKDVKKEEIIYYSEDEKKEIKKRYRKILKLSKPFLQGDDQKMIRKAFNLAVHAHREMRRKSGEPYIYHPLEVAIICVEEIGLGPTAIICALMHDVVEDTEYTLKDIEDQFGSKVSKIIDGLTKIAENFERSQSAQAENFRKMLFTLSEDVRVILIKLADRLHNMRTLSSMARNSQLKIASETIYIYAPLAHRLGLYQIKSELEDLYLKYNSPDEYEEISQKLSSSKASREAFIKRFMKPIKKRLKAADVEFFIKGRPKHIYSISNKLKKQNTSFEKIYDLFAIRIIIKGINVGDREKEKAACWQAYSIVTDEYRPNPDRLKDWISNPRANGYESLHTTVMSHSGNWVEVQIRTERMDEIAEKGYAAHWKYKDRDTTVNKPLDQWINQVRDTLQAKDNSAMEFIEDFRGNLYNEEVFVFTPKGDLKVIRKGATVLDFAFEIHTEIGRKCTAGKLNGQLVGISHVLQNGDQVEILTTKIQKPSEDWLRIVVTSKARNRIKDLLKEENKVYVTDGKEIITKKFKTLGIEPTLESFNQLRAFFNKKDYNEVFYFFGKGYLQPDEIKKFKSERDAHIKKQLEQTVSTNEVKTAKNFEKAIKSKGGNDTLLIGDDLQKIDYTLAQCCNPIPGDDTFGFLTVTEGIKIHRNACLNAKHLLSSYGDRVIKARWASQIEKSYEAIIELNGVNRFSMLKDITEVISAQLSINIIDISFTSKDGIFTGRIKAFVTSTKQLNNLMTKLGAIEGIDSVLRVEGEKI